MLHRHEPRGENVEGPVLLNTVDQFENRAKNECM